MCRGVKHKLIFTFFEIAPCNIFVRAATTRGTATSTNTKKLIDYFNQQEQQQQTSTTSKQASIEEQTGKLMLH